MLIRLTPLASEPFADSPSAAGCGSPRATEAANGLAEAQAAADLEPCCAALGTQLRSAIVIVALRVFAHAACILDEIVAEQTG